MLIMHWVQRHADWEKNNQFINSESRFHSSLSGIYLFKDSIGNIKTVCKTSSKLTIKIPKGRRWRRSALFIVNFEQISHIVFVFPLLTLNKQMPVGSIVYGSLQTIKEQHPIGIKVPLCQSSVRKTIQGKLASNYTVSTTLLKAV